MISLDFETSIGTSVHGPDFRDPANDVYTSIIGLASGDVLLEHSADGFNRTLTPRAIEAIQQTKLIVGHNLSFDLSYIWQTETIKNYVVSGGRVWDTQVAEYLLTGQQHQFASLAELQLKYMGEKEKPSRISYLYKNGIGADKIVKKKAQCPRLFALYEQYCRSDATSPLTIYKKQYTLAVEKGMLPIIEMYNEYLLALTNMTCTGIKIDINNTEKTLRDFNLEHLTHLEQAQNIVKQFWTDSRLPAFNINSPDHKSAVLFGGTIKVDVKRLVGTYKNGNPRYAKVSEAIKIKGFGVPPSVSIPSKKSGVYKTDESVMQQIALKTSRYELQEYCRLQKMAMMYKKAAKTYCQAFLDYNIDGILYPNFNNTQTETGRLSSSKPNMQNISKRNQFGKILHNLFVAPPGWKCVQIDFAQLEIWVLALLSNDETLVSHLLDGIDLHVVRMGYYTDKTYDELFQLSKVEMVDEWVKQRSAAKTVSYQMAYGAQPKKVAESTGLDIDVVETIFNKEAETYPDTFKLAQSVQESIKNTAVMSRAYNIPASKKRGINGSKFTGNLELLPIFDKSGNMVYNIDSVRKVGYWQSPTGKMYHFLDTGRMFNGRLSRNFSFTQPKNYPMQGTAADIQGATTAELLRVLLSKSDKIKMINEIHDSKWFYVREDVLDPCLQWLKDTIENIPKIFAKRFDVVVPFTFPVDIEVGDTFGAMTKHDFKLEEVTKNGNTRNCKI